MSWAKYLRTLLLTGTVAGTAFVLIAARESATSGLSAVRERGELVVAIRQGPTAYYQNAFGADGFEYELAQGYAEELGVRLAVIPVSSAQEALELVKEGDADLAVGQALTPALEAQDFALSLPVQSITQFVVCRTTRNSPNAPAAFSEIIKRNELLVTAGSHHAGQLTALENSHPGLIWREIDSSSDENLLGVVHEEKTGCAVVDANAWDFHRHLYPDLIPVAELPQPTYFGWIQSRRGDSSLRESANAYLARRQADGGITAMRDRHFAHLQTLTSIDSRRFYQAIGTRLPRYADAFRREAARNGIDWRLLAAVAYQESLWQADATSPTGVQGLMQLTLDTALHLGIDDRTDPIASIRGGARYLRQILDALPADIPEVDRTWMALAAYNAGIAHVLDARALTRKRGGNHNSWPEVRANLALLKDPKWYSQTRYGYARGATQAIIYVRHVRRYYDLLVLASNSNTHGNHMLAMGGMPDQITN